MCQLTFISSLNSFPYKGILSFLLALNSTKNQDGWGFYEPISRTLYKSKDSAQSDDALYTILNPLANNGDVKILSHVRLASVNKGLITKENAHPFEKNHLILAHNGTLSLKEGSLPTDITDSEYFAGLLDNEYGKDFDMVKALNNTYKLFDGKFAFLIYSKVENKFYITRGVTATLFKTIVTIKHGNKTRKLLIVNTERETLHSSLETSSYFMQYAYKLTDFSYTAPEALLINSIYTLSEDGSDLVNVGSLTETYKIATTYPSQNKELATVNHYGYVKTPLGGDFARLGKELYNTGLSLIQVEKFLCLATNNTCVQDLHIIPVEKLSDLLNRYYSSKKKKVWYRILNKLAVESDDEAYKITGLEFPYFMNEKSELMEAYRKCLKTTS